MVKRLVNAVWSCRQELAVAVLLCLSAAWLARISWEEWHGIRSDQISRTVSALTGSFEGYTASGYEYAPDVVPASLGEVAFAIHAKSLRRDIERWNQVAAALRGSSLGRSIRLLGYCDSGIRCYGSAPERFSLFGYADPLQMRAVAAADAQGDVVLFDKEADVVGYVRQSLAPEDLARAIVNGIRDGRPK